MNLPYGSVTCIKNAIVGKCKAGMKGNRSGAKPPELSL